jgi:tetratricopeptide (TPR) repeat protein
MRRLLDGTPRLSATGALAIVFSAAYLALGPGCFFSVDEVVVEETAQAVCRRDTLEVPVMSTTRMGRGGASYAHRGPALGYVALPFVAAGGLLDDLVGSPRGGPATGPPRGTPDHPLRWGGRLSIFAALATNAVIGGLTVAVLDLIALRLGVAPGVALAFAGSVGATTLLASESTHFFQHPLEAFALLCGFYFLSGRDRGRAARDSWLGGVALGLAVLARPNAAPAAAVIWLYGAIAARSRLVPGDRRAWALSLAGSAAAPAASVALYLMYNHLQFGSPATFGYGGRSEVFQPSLAGPLRALAAYLFSPRLSVFLFAPLAILVPFVVRRSLRRWPLETAFLSLAAAAHFAVIAFLPVWDGGIAYGPRYLLAPLLLLMPLALPAFELGLQERRRSWRLALAALALAGAVVQVVGVSVDVTTNQWYLARASMKGGRDLVFVPSASPVWVHLRELAAGRHVIPWAWRAVSGPGPALVLLAVLALLIVAGIRRLRRPQLLRREPDWPAVAVLLMSALVAIGLLATSPVVAPVQARLADHVNAGLVAQRAGRDVAAEELHALVLSLDPSNRFALHNLALLQEKCGDRTAAAALYARALASDAAFAPAARNLGRIRAGQPPDAGPAPECSDARECYAAGLRSWHLGDRTAALTVWEQAARRFPAEAWLVRDVAWARFQLGDSEGAARDYRTAVALFPSDDGIRTDLAWALLAGAHYREARRVCDEVLAGDADNAAAREVLARLPK